MRRIITLLLAVFFAAVGYAQVGAWSGELDIQGTKLPLVFHFDDGACTLDSPSQGAKGIKAKKTYTPEGKLKVEIPVIGASYEGFVLPEMIAGTFSQSGASLPLTLKPGNPKINRPQTPVGPFPYATEEISFKNGNFTLNGTICLPEGYTKETPAMVMVTGSGQQNRDEEIMDHKPFAVIADALARNGIATLRFDDRGFEDPTFPFLDFTIEDHKTDAEAAVNLLRERFKHVGAIGHSEGGTIVFLLAKDGKIDFGISLAGMAISGKETLLEQNKTALTAAGLPSNMVDDYCNALERVFEAIRADKSIKDTDLSKVPAALKPNFDVALKQLSTKYMMEFIKTDIRDILPDVKCPILALNGKRDTQVNYVSNLDAIDKGLINSKHEIAAFDGLNHLFQHCQTGHLQEYQTIEETFAPEVLQKIIEWVK